MFSRIVRRTHMYLALFLAPWMLTYALSTLAMNHRRFLQKHLGGETVAFVKESKTAYSDKLDPTAPQEAIARQLLAELGLDGRHSVRRSPSGESLLIYRNDPLGPRRVTYTFQTGNLLVEKQIWDAPTFLEAMHRRRGYESPYATDDIWASSVDLAMAAMVFWAASGLWMWWEMKVTRRWGALATTAGLGLFILFLLTI